ncbi:MAG TPA: hypothetical protein VFI47_01045 [Acidimicrobiales bacterium]|nr:hypothetical protein [Acidimicrobiales bacterium]
MGFPVGWDDQFDFGWHADIPKVCSQCRRPVENGRHRHDGSEQCPLGLAEAVRRVARWIVSR